MCINKIGPLSLILGLMSLSLFFPISETEVNEITSLYEILSSIRFLI